MNKIALSAVALATVAGLAAPAFAEEGDSTRGLSTFDRTALQNSLIDRGVNAVQVNDNGDKTIRVTVADANGNERFVTYDVYSLTPVGVIR